MTKIPIEKVCDGEKNTWTEGGYTYRYSNNMIGTERIAYERGLREGEFLTRRAIEGSTICHHCGETLTGHRSDCNLLTNEKEKV